MVIKQNATLGLHCPTTRGSCKVLSAGSRWGRQSCARASKHVSTVRGSIGRTAWRDVCGFEAASRLQVRRKGLLEFNTRVATPPPRDTKVRTVIIARRDGLQPRQRSGLAGRPPRQDAVPQPLFHLPSPASMLNPKLARKLYGCQAAMLLAPFQVPLQWPAGPAAARSGENKYLTATGPPWRPTSVAAQRRRQSLLRNVAVPRRTRVNIHYDMQLGQSISCSRSSAEPSFTS